MTMAARKPKPAASKQVPTLVTFADAQAILNCGRKSIYNLVKERKLEMVRVGKRMRLTERSVVGLINDQLKASLRDTRP
jgi:excisionase family DNA binding protein